MNKTTKYYLTMGQKLETMQVSKIIPTQVRNVRWTVIVHVHCGPALGGPSGPAIPGPWLKI